MHKKICTIIIEIKATYVVSDTGITYLFDVSLVHFREKILDTVFILKETSMHFKNFHTNFFQINGKSMVYNTIDTSESRLKSSPLRLEDSILTKSMEPGDCCSRT